MTAGGSRRVETAATVVAAGLVAAGLVSLFARPLLPDRQQSDVFTTAVAGLLYLVVGISATATLGALLRATFLCPRPAGKRFDRGPERPAKEPWLSANRAALVWWISASLAVPFNAAAASGLPIIYVLGDPWPYLTSVQTTQAWLVTAVGAGVVFVVTLIKRQWSTAVAATAVTVLLAVPAVVTAQVSVGADHDLATDAAIIFTLATTLWFGAVWAGSDRCAAVPPADPPHPAVAARVMRIARTALVVALLCRIGIAAYELAGRSPLDSDYGLGLIVLFALLVVLAVLTVRPVRGPSALRLARGVVMVIVGLQAALVQMVVPRYLVPQTSTQNFLGYNLPRPPLLAEMALPGRPNLLLTVVALTAVVFYLWGLIRLRRRGDRWPAYRPIAWTAGWVVVLLVSTTHLWVYSSATFAWHMAAHMSLNMLAPPLIVLGGPLTLALRALPADRRPLPGLREALVALTAAPWLQRLLNPLLIWVVFIGSFYVLYFSPLFGYAMRYHWAHQLMIFHFLAIGCEFYGIAIGVDRPPRDVPAVARLAIIFAAMPFHAFFAIAVIAGGGGVGAGAANGAGGDTIGANFYNSLSIGWLTNLAGEQRLGGEIAWATGELPLLVVIVALVGQWFTQEQRLNRRRDRAAARDDDAELGAYNNLLTELARRDETRRTTTP